MAINTKKVPAISYKIDHVTDIGSDKRLNEDTFVINTKRGLFAVFDGATSLTGKPDKLGRTGAYRASNIAKEIFEKSSNIRLEQVIEDVNSRIHDTMLREGVDISSKLNLWATTAAAVKIDENHFDWVQVADSMILVIYKDSTYEIMVEDFDHDISALQIQKKLTQQGVEDPKSSELVRAEVRSIRENINVLYGGIDGEEHIKRIDKGRESLANIKVILLFTDGMLIPKTDPAQKEDFAGIVKVYLESGLKGWLEVVRGIEDLDKNCKKYIRFKNRDDATAIALLFEG